MEHKPCNWQSTSCSFHHSLLTRPIPTFCVWWSGRRRVIARSGCWPRWPPRFSRCSRAVWVSGRHLHRWRSPLSGHRPEPTGREIKRLNHRQGEIKCLNHREGEIYHLNQLSLYPKVKRLLKSISQYHQFILNLHTIISNYPAKINPDVLKSRVYTITSVFETFQLSTSVTLPSMTFPNGKIFQFTVI